MILMAGLSVTEGVNIVQNGANARNVLFCFLFEVRYSRQYYLESFCSTGHTEGPANERKSKSVFSALVQIHCSVDSDLWSRVAGRAAWAHGAEKQAARHAWNGYARRGHERHGPKHGSYGRPYVHDPAPAKATRRQGKSDHGCGYSEGSYRALQGLPESLG